MRVSYHTARRKRRTVCPHKELQSAFIPFITSERVRYESLRTDKRKTRQAFFTFRLTERFRAVRRNLRASPIKEKWLGRFSPFDFIEQISSSAQDLRASPIT